MDDLGVNTPIFGSSHPYPGASKSKKHDWGAALCRALATQDFFTEAEAFSCSPGIEGHEKQRCRY